THRESVSCAVVRELTRGAEDRRACAGALRRPARPSGGSLPELKRPAVAHKFPMYGPRVLDDFEEIIEILEHVADVALGKIGDRADIGVDRVLGCAKPRERALQHTIGLTEAPIPPLTHGLDRDLRRRGSVG